MGPTGQPLVVLVTGASSGIGRATAEAFAVDGAHLVLVGRDSSALGSAESACMQAGAASARSIAVDMSDEDSGVQILAFCREFHPRVDVVVHSAASMAYGTVERLPAEVFEHVVDVSIHGTARLFRAIAPVLREQGEGHLIVISSLLAGAAAPYMGAYVTAKWGQLALTRVLALELRDCRSVHVGIISPGSTNTPIYRNAANVTGRNARPPFPVDDASRIARAVLRQVDRPRRTRQVGLTNRLILAGYRLAPTIYDGLVGPLLLQLSLRRSHPAATATSGNVLVPEGNHAVGDGWSVIRK